MVFHIIVVCERQKICRKLRKNLLKTFQDLVKISRRLVKKRSNVFLKKVKVFFDKVFYFFEGNTYSTNNRFRRGIFNPYRTRGRVLAKAFILRSRALPVPGPPVIRSTSAQNRGP